MPELALGSCSISNDEGNEANDAVECAFIRSQIETCVMKDNKRAKVKLGLKEVVGVTTKTCKMRRAT